MLDAACPNDVPGCQLDEAPPGKPPLFPARLDPLDRCYRFLSRLGSTGDVPHHLRVGVHRIQPADMRMIEWLESKPRGRKNGHVACPKESGDASLNAWMVVPRPVPKSSSLYHYRRTTTPPS